VWWDWYCSMIGTYNAPRAFELLALETHFCCDDNILYCCRLCYKLPHFRSTCNPWEKPVGKCHSLLHRFLTSFVQSSNRSLKTCLYAFHSWLWYSKVDIWWICMVFRFCLFSERALFYWLWAQTPRIKNICFNASSFKSHTSGTRLTQCLGSITWFHVGSSKCKCDITEFLAKVLSSHKALYLCIYTVTGGSKFVIITLENLDQLL